MFRTLLPVLCMALLCGCVIGNDPYSGLEDDPCTPGNVRNGASACELDSISVEIDGEVDDWAPARALVLDETCAAADCGQLLPGEIRLIQYDSVDPDDPENTLTTLAMRVRLAGEVAPVLTDPDLRYRVQLTDVETDEREMVDALIGVEGNHYYTKNGFVVVPAFATTGRPYQFSWTWDGFEAAIPREFLSFKRGVAVFVQVERRSGESWQELVDSPTVLRGCWQGEDVLADPCGA